MENFIRLTVLELVSLPPINRQLRDDEAHEVLDTPSAFRDAIRESVLKDALVRRGLNLDEPHFRRDMPNGDILFWNEGEDDGSADNDPSVIWNPYVVK